MPVSPDLEDFKRPISKLVMVTSVVTTKKTAKQSTASNTESLHTSVMRNWVIMSLCGFNTVLLNIFPIHFPDFQDDFLELSYHIDAIVLKLRATKK